MAKTLRLASPVADKETLNACHVILQNLDSRDTLNSFLNGTLTKIAIPNYIDTIRPGAFTGCYNLTDIEVSEDHPTLSLVDGMVCNKDKTAILAVPACKVSGEFVIPENVTDIGDFAFASCKNLDRVELSSNIKRVSATAFFDCANDFEAKLTLDGETLNQGGTYPMETSEAITSIAIPEDATYVDLDAFKCFPNLNTVYIHGQCDWETHSEYVNKVRVGYNSFTYNKFPIRKLIIGGSNTAVDAFFMYDMADLNEVIVGDNVTSIGNYAFYNCANLTELNIPSSVTSIGTYAFYQSGIRNVIISPNVSYGTSTFSGCYRLSEVVILPGVTSLAACMFQNCESITSITIPGSVTEYASCAFQNCIGLKNLTMEEGPQYIRYSTFYGCTSLENVVIPNTVTVIERYAFYGCTALKDVTIPRSVVNIDITSFSGMTDLTIHGYAGSYAETFANQGISGLNMTFEAIEE